MAPFVSSIDIDRTPEQVFEYATDPTRFAEWQHDVEEVRVQGTDPLGVGSRFTTTRWVGRTRQTMTQEITDNTAPKTWAARGVEGPIRPAASIAVEPLDGGARSRVTFSLDFEGHGIGKPLVPLVRQLAAKGAPLSYQRLKERLESGD